MYVGMKKRFTAVSLGILWLFSPSLYAQKLPFGINLAGADFGSSMPGVYEKDYAYPEKKELDYYHQHQLKLIRLPFRWERIQPQLYGELDAAELTRMKNVVREAEKMGMPVILDMHNYCRRYDQHTEHLLGSEELPVKALGDAWGRLAKAMKGFTNLYGYGLMNEPHDLLPGTSWFTMAQQAIQAIRKVDSQTSILVAGNSWSSAERWPSASDSLKYLKDPSRKLIFEAHLYFDKNGSGMYKHTYEEEKATEDTGINRVKPFVTWLKKNDLKGFIGEYGVPDNDPRWLVVLDRFLNYIQKEGINGTYWAGGSRWGDYTLAVSPVQGTERPQMKVLQAYPSTD
ncbi:endoglucanase [Siphonobacter sp. BAB-5404]|nr:endoglucanase [Siphonobacter sp. SORGH_AS_0500]